MRLIPAAKLSPRKRLRIDVNLPPTARGSALLVQTRYRNGTVHDALMSLSSQGDGHARIGFNRKYVAYVALIPTNTSTSMVLCGFVGGSDGGPEYSCSGRGYYDYGQKYQLRAALG